MNTHQYAPGRPGFGSRGEDGSAGLAGLSLYFTDYNTTTESALIQTAIINNVILCSSTLYDQAAAVLPGGRTYNSGDLFVDINGGVYEITDASTGSYTYKYASLNTAGYFTSAETQTDNHGFRRFFNNNLEPKYIIDNVYASEEANYYSVPSDIYTIEPKNFARIEYSNINQGNYNPFTVYSAGDSDQNSIAIVRDVCSNTFRIGNLDNTGNLRNVKLIFDVSSLRVNKQDSGTHFTPNTVEGTVITNYEINANSLFNGNFDSNPTSFVITPGYNSINVAWDKLDFTNDANTTIDLYVYKDVSNYSSISITNTSDYKPIIYHNCAAAGNLTILGLTELTPYNAYMNVIKNGWERRSLVKSFSTAETPYLIVTNPASRTLNADASGVFDVGSTYIYTVELSTNSISGWDITGDYDPVANPCPPYDSGLDWVFCHPSEASLGVYTFDISISRNTLTTPRSGYIFINSEAPQNYILINQRGVGGIVPPDTSTLSETYISFRSDGTLDVSTLIGLQIDISVFISAVAQASTEEGYADVTTYADMNIQSSSPAFGAFVHAEVQTSASAQPPTTWDNDDDMKSVSIINVSASTNLAASWSMGEYRADQGGDLYAQVVAYIFRAKYHGTNIDVSMVYNRIEVYNQDNIPVLTYSTTTPPIT